jgi:hypothetical protein
MVMSLALSTMLDTTVAGAVECAREALAQQRFEALTQIDMKLTLNVKLAEDMED